MAEFPALPLWTDAYLGDTTHLTTIEHGAYLLLLIVAWRTPDCTLPDDDRLLARYARLEARQWKRIKPILAEFFVIGDGKWMQRRLSDEREAVRTYRTKQSEKGAKGGKAKSLKNRHQRLAGAGNGHDPAEAQVKPDASSLLHTHNTLDKESNGAGAPDSDQLFWANAKAFIGPEVKGDPGAVIGKWSKDYGKEAVAGAITKAQIERPVQRIPFIVGCLKQAAKSDWGGGLSVPC